MPVGDRLARVAACQVTLAPPEEQGNVDPPGLEIVGEGETVGAMEQVGVEHNRAIAAVTVAFLRTAEYLLFHTRLTGKIKAIWRRERS